MPKTHTPRSGSMQVWPRKRAKRAIARVRSWPAAKEPLPLGFPAYKVGMTHILYTEQSKGSHLKGEQVVTPVTVVECPPMRIFGLRAYTRRGHGVSVAKELLFGGEKTLKLRLELKKPATAKQLDTLNPDEFSYFTILVHTQPALTSIGKKVPEVLELHLGGSPAEQLAYVREHLERPIGVDEILAPGQLVDVRGVTTGKGTQGPVKRFGIGLKPHKSEKGRRAPGSIGTWVGQVHLSHRIPRAGQMGYHQRTHYNNVVLSFIAKPEEITPAGGFLHYGTIKNPCLLIKGSLQGPRKRLLTLTRPIRNTPAITPPAIEYISRESQQGV